MLQCTQDQILRLKLGQPAEGAMEKVKKFRSGNVPLTEELHESEGGEDEEHKIVVKNA